jgi:NAD(P)-dependent dehydrogenase (short-subunit alcohol dehydrogenase family)
MGRLDGKVALVLAVEIARLALYLASGDRAYRTGSEIIVGGRMTAG